MIDDLLSLAGDAVAHARKLGADAVHAVAADGRSTEISILDGKIEKVEQSEARDISLKVYSGKSSATISGTRQRVTSMPGIICSAAVRITVFGHSALTATPRSANSAAAPSATMLIPYFAIV